MDIKKRGNGHVTDGKRFTKKGHSTGNLDAFTTASGAIWTGVVSRHESSKATARVVGYNNSERQ